MRLIRSVTMPTKNIMEWQHNGSVSAYAEGIGVISLDSLFLIRA
jgi:hypothetical protein